MVLPEINMSVSPVFLANMKAFNDPKYKIIANQGGARSGKTYSICQLLLHTAQFRTKETISIVSKTLPHLKKGAIRDCNEIIDQLGIFNSLYINQTDHLIRFPSKTLIEFFSADNGAKLRGPGRDYLFINEANLLTYDEWKQLLMRTRKKIFIDFNPVDEDWWFYEYVLNRPENDVAFIHSTFLDNFDFLPENQVKELLNLKNEDNDYWQIYGLGLPAKATDLIYKNYLIDNFQDYVNYDTIYGLDFGYNHPTALVKINRNENNLFIEELLYETEMTNDVLINELKKHISNRTCYIYADSEDPNRIEEIYRAGFNIHPANKGRNSVKEGIDFLKRFKMTIHPSATNIIKELKSYKWKTDKNGKTLDEPVKFNDHALDALRYAVFTHGPKFWQEGNFFMPSRSREGLRKSKIHSLLTSY